MKGQGIVEWPISSATLGGPRRPSAALGGEPSIREIPSERSGNMIIEHGRADAGRVASLFEAYGQGSQANAGLLIIMRRLSSRRQIQTEDNTDDGRGKRHYASSR